MSQRQTFYILLLGQTGVGKSTFVNSIANYFTYSSFQEALAANNPICLVPTKFEVCLRNLETVTISHRGLCWNDDNEQHDNIERSSTCDPRVYEFTSPAINYCVIDVPGIGDTDGTVKDQRNKAAILQKLKEFEILHGIVIVLNSVGPKLTPEIKNCYNEILMELHKDSIPNIMFVFTNCRASSYLPGTSLPPLKAYVKELEQRGIRITLNTSTMFCVDNEGFRYQCGIKNELFKREFENEEYMFKTSWEKSREAIFRMFKALAELPVHRVAQSVAVSEARLIIRSLIGPLAKVFTMITQEMSDEKREAQIQSLMKTGNLIKKEVTVEKLDKPQCVCLGCAANSSTKNVDTQICHKVCRLPGSRADKVGDPKLRQCAIFDPDGRCTKCQCSYTCHVRITQKTKEILLSQDAAGVMSRPQAERIYQQLRITLESEQFAVWEAVIKLVTYLRRNAIVDFNLMFEDKLKGEIEKQEASRATPQVIQQLQKRLEKFKSEMDLINAAATRPTAEIITEQAIKDLLQKLCQLEIHGRIVKKLYDCEVTDALKPSESVQYQIKYSP